jgi:Cold shock proteins
MQGTIKFYDRIKGWGFITDTESEKDIFVHYSSIKMDGFRYLNENDIVNFEVGAGNNGREQAINVYPILTMKMIERSLKEENLHVKVIKDTDHVTKYLVVDQNNVLQTCEQGIDFLELAAFTGYSIVEE